MGREVIRAQDRFGCGQATVTDVEQTKLRLSLARSGLEKAAGQLRVSQIRFACVTGANARNLRMPQSQSSLVPRLLRKAVIIAEGSIPIVPALTAASAMSWKAAIIALASIKTTAYVDLLGYP